MSPAGPVVAVVDDESAVRKSMARLIRSAGLSVSTYASGAEFLASLAEHRPVCAIVDLHMPRMDGFDVIESLREQAVATPVILITGYDTPETRVRATKVGTAAYFRKPVDDEALLAVIARFADGEFAL